MGLGRTRTPLCRLVVSGLALALILSKVSWSSRQEKGCLIVPLPEDEDRLVAESSRGVC